MKDTSARILVTKSPYNAETPLHALAAPVTATPAMFVRSHFDVPHIEAARWRLTVRGIDGDERAFSLHDLQGLGCQSLIVTVECAGNARQTLSPKPAGLPWGFGAAGTAQFTGVPLRAVLDAVTSDRVLEVVFTGADAGLVEGRQTTFSRSLPFAVARLPDTLLAWSMNGAPLTPEHGAPVRLVVPSWYAMASVKWLVEISLSRMPFGGHFQQRDYVYSRQEGVPDGTPVSLMRVRSIIAQPADADELKLEPHLVTGTAWSGGSAIRRVQVSADGGETWADASLADQTSIYAATCWHYRWTPTRCGEHVLIARAADDSGAIQPLEPVWNLSGYGNNAVHRVTVHVK